MSSSSRKESGTSPPTSIGPTRIDAALDGVDRLFLLTRQTGRQLAQEEAVIAAAARAGIGRVVKLSVFRADETSPLQIARQHRRAERALQDSGLQHTVLRPVFFMQNLFAMVRDGTIATAAGDGRVAMIDARDIAAAAVAALTTVPARGRVYTLTGPDAVSFDQVAEVIGRQSGRAVRHRPRPGRGRVRAVARASAPSRGSPRTWACCTACSPTGTRTSSPPT